MFELVTIPVSFLEVTIDYEKPDIRLIADRTALVQGIFEALLPWNSKLDDVEILTTGKFSEQGTMFRLQQKHVALFVGATFCRFSRDAVDWSLAEETIAILDVAVSALVKIAGVVMGLRKTSFGMHLQPLTVPFMDILRPFIPVQFSHLESQPLHTMATVIKWPNRRITIDGSGTLANGVFVKLERDFLGNVAYEAMARQLKMDEEELFAIMGVQEDRR